ncbi:UNVERIFIED_CONTAM: hypothetical protein FKN15_054980 [Acipenser sinensis]
MAPELSDPDGKRRGIRGLEERMRSLTSGSWARGEAMFLLLEYLVQVSVGRGQRLPLLAHSMAKGKYAGTGSLCWSTASTQMAKYPGADAGRFHWTGADSDRAPHLQKLDYSASIADFVAAKA